MISAWSAAGTFQSTLNGDDEEQIGTSDDSGDDDDESGVHSVLLSLEGTRVTMTFRGGS